MDVLSYLLGKESSGGGGGGSSLDWSAIGYSDTPQGIIDGYNYAKNIYDNWDSSQTNLSYKYMNNKELSIFPLVNTSNATNMYGMFNGCLALIGVPKFDTSNNTQMGNMFYNCQGLTSVPLFDTSKVTDMQAAFKNCNSLKNVPLFDTPKVQYMDTMFNSSPNLTDTSLDNILQMCINAVSYKSTKTLNALGFSSSNYPATRIQALPHYQDFIDAGWTIGY